MSDPKRRFLERGLVQAAPGPTVIGAETVVIGDIRGSGPYAVFGEVRGDGDLGGPLHLSETASWYGHVRAHQAVIAGTITGGLDVAEKLEIRRTAVIRGRVIARTIAIAKGAIVDGEIEITSGASIVQFEEKRSETR